MLFVSTTSVNLQETFLSLYKLVQGEKAQKALKVQKQPRFCPKADFSHIIKK